MTLLQMCPRRAHGYPAGQPRSASDRVLKIARGLRANSEIAAFTVARAAMSCAVSAARLSSMRLRQSRTLSRPRRSPTKEWTLLQQREHRIACHSTELPSEHVAR